MSEFHLVHGSPTALAAPISVLPTLPARYLHCCRPQCGWRGSHRDVRAALTELERQTPFVKRHNIRVRGLDPHDLFERDSIEIFYNAGVHVVRGVMILATRLPCPVNNCSGHVKVHEACMVECELGHQGNYTLIACLLESGEISEDEEEGPWLVDMRPATSTEEAREVAHLFHQDMIKVPQYQHLQFAVTAVQPIFNEHLMDQFRARRLHFAESGGGPLENELTVAHRAYHGTCADQDTWESIALSNLRVPSEPPLETSWYGRVLVALFGIHLSSSTSTDGWFGNQWFGAGAYVSQHPDYCFKYCVDNTKGEKFERGSKAASLVLTSYRVACTRWAEYRTGFVLRAVSTHISLPQDGSACSSTRVPCCLALSSPSAPRQ